MRSTRLSPTLGASLGTLVLSAAPVAARGHAGRRAGPGAGRGAQGRPPRR